MKTSQIAFTARLERLFCLCLVLLIGKRGHTQGATTDLTELAQYEADPKTPFRCVDRHVDIPVCRHRPFAFICYVNKPAALASGHGQRKGVLGSASYSSRCLNFEHLILLFHQTNADQPGGNGRQGAEGGRGQRHQTRRHPHAVSRSPSLDRPARGEYSVRGDRSTSFVRCSSEYPRNSVGGWSVARVSPLHGLVRMCEPNARVLLCSDSAEIDLAGSGDISIKPRCLFLVTRCQCAAHTYMHVPIHNRALCTFVRL